MKINDRTPTAFVFLTTGQFAQAGWLLFTMLALSVALPGIKTYYQILQTVCTTGACLTGQLNPAEAQVTLAAGDTLSTYANIILSVFLFTDALLLLTAAAFMWRKPANPAAVYWAFALVAAGTSTLVQAAAKTFPGLQLPAQILQLIQVFLLFPCFASMPDGKFRPGWLRWAALALLPAAVLLAFDLVGPNLRIVSGGIIGVLVVGSAIYRYASLTDFQQKEQAAWALAAVALLAGAQWIGKPLQLVPLPAVSLNFLTSGLFNFFPVFGMLLVVGAVTCLAVALLGDELFRVDVALNRAVVYSLLTLVVVGMYVLVVGYLSMIFQSSGSLWLSLVATGVVAALFHPIRERIQRFVNRMIYGDRDDPYAVISQLGKRLETVITLDQVIPTILDTVREALKVSYAAIALSQPGGDKMSIAAEKGEPNRIVLSLPLVYQSEIVGQLQLGSRQGENTFSPADRRLLNDLARQAGAAIHAARQNADLQIARERLVIAQEEERRRIRRDLHDGLGASLAALNLQAGEVQRLIANDPETASRRMADLRFGLRTAVGDIRRLVYGLRPPALDELGLLEALRSRIAQYQSVPAVPPGEWNRAGDLPVQIRFDAPDQLPQLPAAVEVAVYRIVEEGLANIVHHAQAKNGLIHLVLVEQDVQVEISDDGIGLLEGYQPGAGLHSMRERAAELGGRMTVQSAPGRGMQVCAWLPANIVEVLHRND